jgi:hypothetical protein
MKRAIAETPRKRPQPQAPKALTQAELDARAGVMRGGFYIGHTLAEAVGNLIDGRGR